MVRRNRRGEQFGRAQRHSGRFRGTAIIRHGGLPRRSVGRKVAVDPTGSYLKCHGILAGECFAVSCRVPSLMLVCGACAADGRQRARALCGGQWSGARPGRRCAARPRMACARIPMGATGSTCVRASGVTKAGCRKGGGRQLSAAAQEFVGARPAL